MLDDLRAHAGVVSQGPLSGQSLLVMTSTGAVSGLPRRAFLAWSRDGGDYIVAATANGAPKRPGLGSRTYDERRGSVEAEGRVVDGTATDRRRRPRTRPPLGGATSPVLRTSPIPGADGRVIPMVRVDAGLTAAAKRAASRNPRSGEALAGTDRASRRFSGGASGQAHCGSNAHDGWKAKLKSQTTVRRAGSPPRSALFAASRVAAGAVASPPVRRVAERQEEAADIAGHPERASGRAPSGNGDEPSRPGGTKGASAPLFGRLDDAETAAARGQRSGVRRRPRRRGRGRRTPVVGRELRLARRPARATADGRGRAPRARRASELPGGVGVVRRRARTSA